MTLPAISAADRPVAEQVCAIGRRLWQRGYVNGTDGNVSVRVDDDRILCTPTQVSKGFMDPADLCAVDLAGHQVGGQRPRTSEILVHTAIYRRQAQARAVVHCHSPYGTAFAGLDEAPPREIYPEKEVWLGEIARAPYRQSATEELGAVVAPLADRHPVILLANHGVVTWGRSLEEAYWRVEMLEGYLQTVTIARQYGGTLQSLTADQMKPLLELKQRLGIVDPRL